MATHTQLKHRKSTNTILVLLAIAILIGLSVTLAFAPWGRVLGNTISGGNGSGENPALASPEATATAFKTKTPAPTITSSQTATATAIPTNTVTPTETATPTATLDPAVVELAKQSDYSGLTKIMEDPLVKSAIEEGKSYTIVSMYDEYGYPSYYGPFSSARVDEANKIVYAYGMADLSVVTEISYENKVVLKLGLGVRSLNIDPYRDPLMELKTYGGMEIVRLFKFELGCLNKPVSDEALWITIEESMRATLKSMAPYLQEIADDSELFVLVFYVNAQDKGYARAIPSSQFPTPKP